MPRAADATLAGTLARFLDTHGTVTVGGFFDALTPLIERIAVRGTDLPPTASSLGFVYRFDPETGSYEREVGPLESIFVEPARAVGRRRLVLGASYQHAELTEYEGDDLAEQLTLRQTVRFEGGGGVDATLRFTQLDVTADVVTPFVTYGVTDDWDVNVLLPITRTSLVVRADKIREVTESDGPARRDSSRVRVSDDAIGPGDLLLRTKRRFVAVPVDLSLGFVLRAPTGDSEQFQGLGDWTAQPVVILGRRFAAHEAHLNLGVEANADDLERTRARWAVGGSVQPRKGLAFILDLIGSSSFVDDEFEITRRNFAPVRSTFLERFEVRPPAPVPGGYRAREALPRTDLVDLAVGIKWNPLGNAFVFASVLVPVTTDGLRADAIPGVGAQYVF